MPPIHSLTLDESGARNGTPERVAPALTQLTREEGEAYRAYHAERRTYAGAAAALGVSENQVRQRVRSAEAKLALRSPGEQEAAVAEPTVTKAKAARPRIWTAEEDTRLLELRQTLSQREVAAQLDRTPATVSWREGILRRKGAAPAPAPAPPPPVAPFASLRPPVAPPAPAVTLDPEIRLLAVIHAQLTDTDEPARRRILAWLTDRFSEAANEGFSHTGDGREVPPPPRKEESGVE